MKYKKTTAATVDNISPLNNPNQPGNPSEKILNVCQQVSAF
jgi:hypothetical protein